MEYNEMFLVERVKYGSAQMKMYILYECIHFKEGAEVNII
jgi:hypothetical protein